MAAVGEIEAEDAVMGIEDGGISIQIGRGTREGWRSILAAQLLVPCEVTHAAH